MKQHNEFQIEFLDFKQVDQKKEKRKVAKGI